MHWCAGAELSHHRCESKPLRFIFFLLQTVSPSGQNLSTRILDENRNVFSSEALIPTSLHPVSSSDKWNVNSTFMFGVACRAGAHCIVYQQRAAAALSSTSSLLAAVHKLICYYTNINNINVSVYEACPHLTPYLKGKKNTNSITLLHKTLKSPLLRKFLEHSIIIWSLFCEETFFQRASILLLPH